MSNPLLLSKLYIPTPRQSIVSRPRLIERLNQGLRGKLILISAPAGFGKTTLVSEWIASCGLPVAWLSLDEGDNDPMQFMIYLVAVLQRITARIGEGVLVMLQSPQPPATEILMTELVNEISTIPNDFVIVLDDYHVIDSINVDTVLAFLIEHKPPQMHLLITTREDPHLPLARLRARGQLTELRAVDLRFMPSEAAEFLNQVIGLNLSVEDITALEKRTEGWIAGLQLAAISLQGNPDVVGFIKSFTGSHRFVMDYLLEEVLHRQPDEIQSFLLRTSILERMSGPLCEAVVGITVTSGQEILEYLDRTNLFIVPLDSQRHWFRYHHLFGDLLQQRLHHSVTLSKKSDCTSIAELHRRASKWYEENGLAVDAIRHALAALDFERAATLIELTVPAMRRNRQEATIVELGWLKALPDELIQSRPVLCVAYAYALFGGGEPEAIEFWLQKAEHWLDTLEELDSQSDIPARGMVVVDEKEFHRLPGMIALLRTAHALARGDMPTVIKNARRVLDLAPKDDYLMLGGAASTLGLAAWASGDIDTALRMISDGMTNVYQAGYISPAIGDALTLADLQIVQGNLKGAMTTFQQGLKWATESGSPIMRGAADMYVGMGSILYEQNELTTALQHLHTSQALGKLAGLPQNPYRWCATMARLQMAQGDLPGALDLLDQAERLYNGNFSPNSRPIATRKIRLWLALGRLDEALGWVREQGLAVDDTLSYLKEFDHITLARVLIAQFQDNPSGISMSRVGLLLERLQKAAEIAGRNGSLIEILVMQAITHQLQGELPMALLALEHALELAEPGGYVRIFVDEGKTMSMLVEELSRKQAHPLNAYSSTILAAFEAPDSVLKSCVIQQKPILIDPLSERELQVLRLLRSELSGPEIANQLSVSINTFHTHTKSIFIKLEVNTRRAAIRRAEELLLI